jgi:hypothetical protein
LILLMPIAVNSIKILWHLFNKMYQIQLKFKGQSKKITVAKSLQTSELQRLIAQCFGINEKVIGVTNKSGCFLELNEFNKQIPSTN